MKTRAAVLHDVHKPFEIMELDLDAPKDGEVLIRYAAAGLCHSDLHLIDGDLVPAVPHRRRPRGRRHRRGGRPRRHQGQAG